MKMLNRMLKDAKNTEYKDRIYYAMADVAMENKNETDGVKYLRKSVASSTNNNRQKVKSSLDVANILFKNSDYVLSQAYFDTAVMTMDRTYPGYDSLLNISVMLTDLVSNLTCVLPPWTRCNATPSSTRLLKTTRLSRNALRSRERLRRSWRSTAATRSQNR